MITLRQTIHDIKEDLPKKSFRTFLRCYFYSAGFRVLLNHRIGKFLFYNRFMFSRQIALYYKYKLVSKRGCDISYTAQIGKNVCFPHAIGVIIGNNVKIWQQVTFGSHGKLGEKLEYPIVKDNVKIFAGAKIIGGLTIGEDSMIGASSLINKDVPANSVAYGIPFKIKGQ